MKMISLISLLVLNLVSATALACNLPTGLREGDVVFRGNNGSPTSRLIAETTQSWTHHVGILMKKNGGWVVYHAIPPHVTYDNVCKFIAKGQWAILSHKQPLSEREVETIRDDAEDAVRKKIEYDLTNLDAANKTHCSKFVHTLFQGVRRTVGVWQSLRAIAAEYTGSAAKKQSLIQQWDERFHGALLGGNALTRAYAWSKQTVTPASLLRDSELSIVKCTVGTKCLDKM